MTGDEPSGVGTSVVQFEQHGSASIRPASAWLLFGAPALLCFVVLSHPALGPGKGQIAPRIAAMSNVLAIMHAAVALLVLCTLIGIGALAALAPRESTRRRSGEILAGVGALALMTAAFMDGFVVGPFTTNCMSSPGCEASITPQLQFIYVTIQALTRIGLLLVATSIIAWAMLLPGRMKAGRFLGGCGAAMGLGATAWLLLDQSKLEPFSLALVCLATFGWYAAVGAVLCNSRRLPAAAERLRRHSAAE